MSVSAPEKPQLHDLYDVTEVSWDEQEVEARICQDTLNAPVAVPELPEDKEAVRRASAFIGSCVVAHECKVAYTPETISPVESLYDAIQKAKSGDKTARRMVEINAKTDIIERTIKSGHVTKVKLHVDNTGVIQQFGQDMVSVQANSLRFAADNSLMRPRVEAEATNTFRTELLYETGALDDASFLVFSCAPDNMTKQEMEDVGFFTDTMSCAIQLTTPDKNKSVIDVESAFVSGIKQPGVNNERVDIETVVAIGKRFGVDFSGMSATEILATPIRVPNSMLKNGVLDVVRMWDEYHGDTFFGEAREKQDYEMYRKKCLEREQMLQPKVDLITDELIASADKIHDRVSAVQYLNKLSGKHMIEQAVFDTEINPAVFGVVAAQQVYEARLHFEQGNFEQGMSLTQKAIQNDQSTSCPGGSSRSQEIENTSTSSDSDNETCLFVSRQCPKCGKKNVLTKSTKTYVEGISCRCIVFKK